MNKQNFFRFKNLSQVPNLINGVFGKKYGNVSFKLAEKGKVIHNRQKIVGSLGIDLNNLYEMKQVHGSRVVIIDKSLIKKLNNNIILNADGLITKEKNIFLMVKTADCFPVFLHDRQNKIIAAIHIGWRGAVEKVFFTALFKMVNVFHSVLKNILVAIGPGIEKCCFHFKELFQENLPEWNPYIKKINNGFKSINLADFIQDKLIEIGVKKQNIEKANMCTACSSDFFSHFRSRKTDEEKGRFASIIGIRKDD